MERLRLLHLTFIGPSISPATVEFGPKLTLVRGPSDTGKSFIADTLDFMLGGKKLDEIPQLDGYDQILLGVRLPNGEAVTLVRSPQGGGFRLFTGDHRGQEPLPVKRTPLSLKHNAENTSNLSNYLLDKIGLGGKVVRKNGSGQTVALSLRLLVPLFLVGETKIQAETPPILTGQHIHQTRDISTFRLLLQGEDDSAIEANTSETERRKSRAAKNEVIDALLDDWREQLNPDEDLQQVNERLMRAQRTISRSAESVEQAAAARQQWGQTLSNNERLATAARRSLAELDTLEARFTLLHEQYTSDLDRLDAVAEAGTLLGYFTPGRCVFCGADPEHQHFNADCADDTTAFAESVREEQRKTTALREDLREAMAGLRDEHEEKSQRLRSFNDQAAQARREIARLDDILGPQETELRELLTLSSRLQRDVETLRRIQQLEALRTSIGAAPKLDAMAPTAGLRRTAIAELSGMIADRLRAWGFDEADHTSYSFDDQDLVSGNQLRSAHGKGVRAILHAAFTISLAQYCFDNDLPHPGFVVLDSPLVVYRPPDPNEPDDSGNILDTASLAGRFYADIQTNFSGQIIVLENQNPPNPLDTATQDTPFTKNADRGRYGLFPHREESGRRGRPRS
ncbi:hypothetical protein DMC64_18570 [Amycolatopsis sp. WAC 04197]|uniref:ATP-binding protein n=1 Tax=Amycolatopsis sp. WAC 04197 TaxID=2203199 RepID=UPI000F76BD9D|nr:ATP-binding protein [Amycolatopsis sp. WAC 04197]RSN44892.1 hypothetical protein DMC64_18570 [Amycolatopsis sp. WAC 04197]